MFRLCKVLFIFFGVHLFLSSCQSNDKASRVVVSVGTAELTVAQLLSQMPSSFFSPADSAVFADDVVRTWVYKQVLLQKAVNNVDTERERIEKAVDDYRTSLIIETYQKMLVEQKFDPNISNNDICEYYSEMKTNFTLKDPIIKGLYAILPANSPDFKSFEKKLKSFNEESAADIEGYLFKYSGNYKVSVDNWMPFSSVKKFFPNGCLSDNVLSLKSAGLTRIIADGYIYLILVTKACPDNAIAPIEYVEKDIYTILLSKKKLEFLSNTNSEIYHQALKNNDIKYYDKND